MFPTRSLVALLLLLATVPTGAQGPARKKPLGPNINTTTHRELIPVISPDGQTLWFIREGVDAESGSKVATKLESDLKVLEAQLEKLPPEQRKQLEDVIKQNRAAAPKLTTTGPVKQTIFVSHRLPDGSWAVAERVPAPLNSEVNSSAVVTALPDGNTLLVGNWNQMAAFQEMAKQMEGANLMDLLKQSAPGSRLCRRWSRPIRRTTIRTR